MGSRAQRIKGSGCGVEQFFWDSDGESNIRSVEQLNRMKWGRRGSLKSWE